MENEKTAAELLQGIDLGIEQKFSKSFNRSEVEKAMKHLYQAKNNITDALFALKNETYESNKFNEYDELCKHESEIQKQINQLQNHIFKKYLNNL